MNDAMLRADCARCAALCCVCLAFDESELFAFDKAAGVACPNLNVSHQCAIHAQLEPRGFAGCVRFDCLGAGQRVTQEVFQGRSWRDDAALIQPMADAFRAMRRVHELLALLHSAAQLPLTPLQAQQRYDLQSALEPSEDWSQQALMAFERGNVATEIQEFLTTLRHHVARDGPRDH